MTLTIPTHQTWREKLADWWKGHVVPEYSDFPEGETRLGPMPTARPAMLEDFHSADALQPTPLPLSALPVALPAIQGTKMASLLTIGTTVLTALTQAGAASDDIASVEGFVNTVINYAETTTQTGAQKLSAVILAVKTYVADALPQLKVDYTALTTQLTSFINGLVALWNALGVFVKDAVADVKSGVAAVEAAV